MKLFSRKKPTPSALETHGEAVQDERGVEAALKPEQDLMAVVAEYETPLLRYANGLLGAGVSGTGAGAEDVVQEAFIRLHKYWQKPDAQIIERLDSWLFKVCHRLAMDVLRKYAVQKRLRENYKEEQGVDEMPMGVRGDNNDLGGGGIDGLIRREAGQRALAIVKTLPDDERQVVLLKIIQDMSIREVAKVTGLTLGKTAYRLKQGLARVTNQLKAEDLL